MSKPWMPLYVSDYLGDTQHLTTLEHGAYLLLIMHYWQHKGLPADDERLARITGLVPQDWAGIRPTIAAFFQDGWQHERIEREFALSIERSKAGRRGGRPKANAKQNAKQNESKTKAPQPHPHIDGGGGDAREAPSDSRPLVSKQAKELADAIAGIAGVGIGAETPPGWCGAPMRAQAFLDAGWQPEIMLAAAQATTAKKRDGPPDTINYFEKPFARAHAQQAAPLPLVEVSIEPQKISMRDGHAEPNRGNTFKSALANLSAEIDRRDRLSESGEDHLRLVANGRG